MSNPTPRADRLSLILRRLRRRADLSGVEAARRAGMSQATISRFETGKRVPTEGDIRALCEVYGASLGALRELLSIADDLREGSTSARTVLHHHGAPSMQARIGRIEASSARIRSFHPAIVIGLLQTYDYARALLSGRFAGRELDAMVAARLARQQILDTDREFHFVLTEGALRWHVGSPQIMGGQAEHLAELVKLPNVRLGIIPWTRPTNRPVLHAFQICDDRAVMVSTETSVALVTDARDVADFAARFEIYAGFADYDAAATAVFRRIADEYRELVKDS
ncbi:MAG TPA: helix-turn-helix transcriptional regulator [Pseudonocardiaceae bacterium]|nr:helix-turn-helix transcriptional regulator [Pseudonocardiaceae bacterium]